MSIENRGGSNGGFPSAPGCYNLMVLHTGSCFTKPASRQSLVPTTMTAGLLY